MSFRLVLIIVSLLGLAGAGAAAPRVSTLPAMDSAVTSGVAALPYYEPFNYAIGNLVPNGNWTQTGANTDGAVQVIAGSLAYPDFPAAKGRHVLLENGLYFEDPGLDIGPASGDGTSVYVSCLLNVLNPGSATGDYVLHVSSAGTSSTDYMSRIFVRQSSVTIGKYNIGLKLNSASECVWDTVDRDTLTPILLVFSYDFVSGALNDTARVWINPPPCQVSPPAATLQMTNGGIRPDLPAVGRLNMRQPAMDPFLSVEFDELRAGTGWTDVVPASVRIDSPVHSGSIVVGDTLRFSGHAQLVSPHFEWDFGDGRSSTLQNPGLMSFLEPGSTTVSLSVTDSLGWSTTDTRTINAISQAGPMPDLTVSQVNVPPSLGLGQQAQITYVVQNSGDGSLSGQSWNDAVYLSSDPYLDKGDQLLTTAPITEDLPAGGSYNGIMLVTLPFNTEGAYYLILSVDDDWQILERHQLNNEHAVSTDVVIPRLQNGIPMPGAFPADRWSNCYKVEVVQGKALKIALDEADNQGVNELYLRRGSLPTRGAYDYRGTSVGADQQILVSAAAQGTWYILAYSSSLAGSGAYTIKADITGLALSKVLPDHYGAGADATLTLTGSGFENGVAVNLVAAGGVVYPATSTQVDSFTQITVTFAAGTVPVGTYTVRISHPGGDSVDLPKAFQITSGGQANLETNVVVPSQIGYHVPATIYVEYKNTGGVAMPAPLLVLGATQRIAPQSHPELAVSVEGAFLTLDQSRLVKGFWTGATPEGFSHSVQILASGEIPGVLQPGETCRVPVYYAGWQPPLDFSFPAIHWKLGVFRADDTTAVGWATLKSSMKPATTSADAWEVVWANYSSHIGGTWGDYVRKLDDNAAYLGRLGERVVDVGRLVAFEFLQADGLSPLGTLASADDASVEASGLPPVFSRSFPATITPRFELGPLGRGWSHNWQYSLSVAADGTVAVTGPGGSRRSFQPDSRPGGRYFTQAGDHGTLTALAGGTFSLRESAGLTQVFRADGKLDYVQDLNGNRITCAYSGSGLLTGIYHSSGRHLQIAYNSAGRIQIITDDLGRQTILSYDNANEHLLSAQYYDGRIATYAYAGTPGSSQHALTEVANSGCGRRYFSYDTQGRVSGTCRTGNAEPVSFSYDNSGKVTATNALGHSNQFYLDNRGLLVKTEDALGNAVHLAFDDNYNLICQTDPAGRSYTFAYDGRGNMVRSTDPLGNVTAFAFTTELNRLSTVIDANSNVTNFAYDGHGNLQSITHADASNEAWTFDSQGNTQGWRNRRGHSISYVHDANGHLTSKIYPDGSHVDYFYDGHGKLVQTDDPTGVTKLYYNANDYLTTITYPCARSLAFTYDAGGRRASTLDQLGHRLDYGYNELGQLEKVKNESQVQLVHYEYDGNGRMTRKALANGIYTRYEYDSIGLLSRLTNCLPDGSILSLFDYAYDSCWRRIAMTTMDGAWTYEYDDLGQLIHAVLDSTNPSIPDQDLIYLYDSVGNRTRTVANGTAIEYAVNSLNQYERVGSTSFTYDKDGNLEQDGSLVYHYDDENRVVAVSHAADRCEYAYDAMNNLVATTENGVTKRFVIDPVGWGNVVGEYDNTGTLLAHYDHDFGLLSKIDPAGTPVYYTFDALGSVQQLVTPALEIANAYVYGPFGTILSKSESMSNPFQFLGGVGVMQQTSGINYMRARFQIPGLGRFVSCDPLKLVGGDVNCYTYVKNSPISSTDPSGCGHFVKWFLTAENANPLLTYSALLNPIADVANLEFVHEQYVFDDGSNVGFGPGGSGPGFHFSSGGKSGLFTKDNIPNGAVPTSGEFDDSLIQTAIENLTDRGLSQSEAYNGYSNNCQDWAEALRQEYERLLDEGESDDSATANSVDPNSKTGPAGFGTDHFVAAAGILAYRVDFENETSALAPAQQVAVTDQLDRNLDWSTFQVTEVGFGDQLMTIPSNSQHYETTAKMSFNGVDFDVQIEAGIRLDTGEVYCVFHSIDPATTLPPSVNVGFLPPEDGSGRGMGHFSYIVKARPGSPTGTQIRNIALISFDNQPVIPTDQVDPHDPSKGRDAEKQCMNTLDAIGPQSVVASLPSVTNQTPFLVTWSGSDDAGGSDVGSYDIYLSDNSGPYALWQDHTTSTMALFSGTDGHTYKFYSIARDNTGNLESAPSTPDAVTTVHVPKADLVVANSGAPNPVFVGNPLTYVVSVTNHGPADASNVVATDTLPSGVAFVSVASSQGTASRVGGVVTANLGTLGVGASATVTIVVTPESQGTLHNTATVNSAIPDPNAANNTVTASTTVNPQVPSADLAITKTGAPGTVTLGGNLTYTVLVKNNGPDAATNVIFSDPLPGKVIYVTASASQGSAAMNGNTLIGDLGSLAKDAVAQITLVVTPTVAGTLSNTGQVTADQADAITANNLSTVSTPVVQGSGPDLAGTWSSLTQTVKTSRKGTSRALRGTFVVSNRGDKDAANSSLLFYLSDDPVSVQGDLLLKTMPVGKVKAGKTSRKSLNVSLPAGRNASARYVIAVVDGSGGIAEANEFNNSVPYGPIP